ncbi:glycosyltransferase family 2 protein [Kribbella deserti]|uniref:Glycosyltransferase family 2 protein n=1 Tax=Kribbella deserti TaxID=1926257 RepID=A0ABV6QF57_9ACTN
MPELEPGLTVLLPCYNEADHLDAAWASIHAALGAVDGLEVLIVDDGSTDATLERIRALAASDDRVRYLSFTRNFGLEAAQEAGFRHASKQWLVQLDADLQSPPEEALKLLTVAQDGGYDVVFGIREHRRDPWVRRLGSAGLGLVARAMLDIRIPRGASVFRVIHTPVARTIAAMELGSPYTVASIISVGARYACVPTSHRQRSGRSRWRPGRLVGHAFELFFSYSWRPLNAAYAVAVGAALSCGLLALLALTGALDAGTVAAGALLILAAKILVTAVIGRYLHRSILDARHGPAYLVRETNLEIPARFRLDGGLMRLAG